MPRAECALEPSHGNITVLCHLKVKYISELCFIALTIVMLLLRFCMHKHSPCSVVCKGEVLFTIFSSLISISDTVSNGATKTVVLNIEMAQHY